ncbi:hypothetical protein SDC9_187267 [bioreactor metagenome]|uniref:Uncharacterized protein n=1 Tax=bioreactor metagenome TaxID=1076179 RepID=A0A645HL65_9ZZZZ
MYTIEFTVGSQKISLTGYFTPMNLNNADSDHFVFTSDAVETGKYECLCIKMTSCANEHDLMQANFDLSGKTVISLLFKEISTCKGDVYYWQGEIKPLNSVKELFSNVLTVENIQKKKITPEKYENIKSNSGELYYMKDTAVHTEEEIAKE